MGGGACPSPKVRRQAQEQAVRNLGTMAEQRRALDLGSVRDVDSEGRLRASRLRPVTAREHRLQRGRVESPAAQVLNDLVAAHGDGRHGVQTRRPPRLATDRRGWVCSWSQARTVTRWHMM